MNFKYINKIVLPVVLLILGSCNFGDTNIDPSNPLSVPLSASSLPSAQARLAYVLGGDVGRYNGMFTQHTTGGGRQHIVIGKYNLQESDVDNVWTSLYSGVLQDLKEVQNLSNVAGKEAPYYSGICKVLTALTLGHLTDLYGNVPYSASLLGIDNLKPTYDTREQVYNTIHQLISEAKTELSSDGGVIQPKGDDLIYGGDVAKWIKAANTIDARYYLHQGQMSEALSALSKGFTSESDDMLFKFESSASQQHPWFQWEHQRGDVLAGKTFVDMLLSLEDPRLSHYIAASNNPNLSSNPPLDSLYIGLTAGGIPADGEIISLVGSFLYTKADGYVPLITYTESKFIEAEASLSTSAGTAAAAYNEGVKSSLRVITGAEDATYVTTNASKSSVTLEDIMTQKYIALFMQPETWNDWRRTKIPALSAAENGIFGDKLIERWPYPQSERLYNPDNHAANNPSGEVRTTPLSW